MARVRSRPKPSSPSTRDQPGGLRRYKGASAASSGGLTREVGALKQVVQTAILLPSRRRCEPAGAGRADGRPAGRPRSTKRLVIAWSRSRARPATRSQVSPLHLFVDNVIDAENRPGPGHPGRCAAREPPVAGCRRRAYGPPGPGARRGSSLSPPPPSAGGGEKSGDANPPALTATRSKPTVVSSWSTDTVSRGAGGGRWRAVQDQRGRLVHQGRSADQEGWNISRSARGTRRRTKPSVATASSSKILKQGRTKPDKLCSRRRISAAWHFPEDQEG